MAPKKWLMTFGAVLGAGAAAAAHHWPSQKSTLQMGLYSLVVLGILSVFLWSRRDVLKVELVTLIVLAIHCIFLFLIHEYFPFKTVLVIVPLILAEAVLLLSISVKLLDEPPKWW